MNETLAFIGGGRMAAALIGGLLTAGRDARRFQVAEPDPQRRSWLQDRYGLTAQVTAQAAAAEAHTVVLAVKPQVMAEAVQGLRLKKGTLVLSIAAGIRLAALREWLGDGVALIRGMPNTPALMGSGISALYAGEGVSSEARSRAEAVLAAVGATLWVGSEDELDAVTAVSGSGPAYYFVFTEALRDAGVALGLDYAVAERLATHTLAGAGRMVEGSGQTLPELRENVTSKGGTTEAALRVLKDNGLRQLLRDALTAAAQRARELGEQLSQTR